MSFLITVFRWFLNSIDIGICMTTKKTVYLHIGLHKTGSTAIQIALDSLHKKGILQENGFDLLWEDLYLLFNACRYESPTSPALQTLEQKIHDFVQASPLPNVIVSCEGFSVCHEHHIKALGKALAEHDVKVLCYIRRQDHMLESCWAENIKNFSGYIAPTYNWKQHWETMFSQYAQCFGKHNILLRVYSRDLLYLQDAASDFLQWINLEKLTDLIEYENINPSLSASNVRIRLSFMRQNMLSKEEKGKRVKKLKEEIKSYKDGAPWGVVHSFDTARAGINVDYDFIDNINELLSLEVTPKKNTHAYMQPDHREQYLAQFKEENAAIAREYMDKDDGELFDGSIPQDTVDINHPTTDDIVTVFLPIFVNLNKRIHFLEDEVKQLNTRVKHLEVKMKHVPQLKFFCNKYLANISDFLNKFKSKA